MKVLVLNCGSSSIKYQMFDMPGRRLLGKGMVERIGEPQAAVVHQSGDDPQREPIAVADHAQAMSAILARLIDGKPSESINGVIAAVGHRVVHGGEEFTGSVMIDDEGISSIEKTAELAPLHNGSNLVGIRAAMHALPNVPQIACFDTAFHSTLPEIAYVYALPYELYGKFGVRRYGFHGTSHQYVAGQAAEILGRAKHDINCITCHLGNGCSMTAVRNGVSVDTSMGLTPLEGLVMGTRCGDIDPAILFHLAENGYDLKALNELCNKKSGLLGISGLSNDMRTLIDAAGNGNERARLAVDIFCYRVKKYIGAYAAVLGHVDALVFTGGIGENAAVVREKICAGLDLLGIKIDPLRNATVSDSARRINADDGGIAVMVIPTDEEGAIAEDSYRLVTTRKT